MQMHKRLHDFAGPAYYGALMFHSFTDRQIREIQGPLGTEVCSTSRLNGHRSTYPCLGLFWGHWLENIHWAQLGESGEAMGSSHNVPRTMAYNVNSEYRPVCNVGGNRFITKGAAV